jgi:glycosyltransferase involved in cell wall biosynthesis
MQQSGISANARMAIYIPAYNAALTITNVLERIPNAILSAVAEIFVVDNCSTDNTSGVAVNFGKSRGIDKLNVIRNDKNEGYGGSQKIAYRRAITEKFKGIAMLHGDAQYAPECLNELMTPIANGEADMVFGSRMSGNPLKGGMPLHRFLGNRALTIFQNIFLGLRLSEYHSGYRVYSVEALKKIPFERLSSDYHFDTEIIILMKHHGLKIIEIPIPTHYGDEENYVNIWKYGIDVLVTTMSYFLHRIHVRTSQNWARILGSGK